jgi:hypothetical protein
VLDERQVCLHYARKLLQQRAVWPLDAFLPAWEQEVPGGVWTPSEDMLSGEALVLQADPLEGTRQSKRGLGKYFAAHLDILLFSAWRLHAVF